MTDRDLYRQKKQAQLDEWRAEVDKLKAKASGARADAKLRMNEHLRTLERKLDEGRMKMSVLAEASDDAWESIKDGMEDAWESMRAAVKEARAKFRE